VIEPNSRSGNNVGEHLPLQPGHGLVPRVLPTELTGVANRPYGDHIGDVVAKHRGDHVVVIPGIHPGHFSGADRLRSYAVGLDKTPRGVQRQLLKIGRPERLPVHEFKGIAGIGIKQQRHPRAGRTVHVGILVVARPQGDIPVKRRAGNDFHALTKEQGDGVPGVFQQWRAWRCNDTGAIRLA